MNFGRAALRTLLAATLITGTLAAAPAQAQHWHHGGWGVGVYVGGPFWWGPGPYWGYPGYWGYPDPYYYYPPAVAVTAPPTYIERGGDGQATTAPPNSYWYYCGNPSGYYPYVQECSGGWQKVVPTPPNPK